MRRLFAAVVLTGVAGAASFALAAASPQAAPAATPAQEAAKPELAPPAKNDYSRGETWLCRPGRQDACAVDLTTTVVAADGKMTAEAWAADPNAPIDCFYVYPTVSNDPGGNSSMNAEPEELAVIRAQFARFASKCRPYAPLYRQVTDGVARGDCRVADSGGPAAGLQRRARCLELLSRA